MTQQRRLREQVAEEVRALLARRRMSGVQLAVHLGTSQGYVSRRLTAVTPFDVDDLERLAELLDVSVIDLLSRPAGGPGGVHPIPQYCAQCAADLPFGIRTLAVAA